MIARELRIGIPDIPFDAGITSDNGIVRNDIAGALGDSRTVMTAVFECITRYQIVGGHETAGTRATVTYDNNL
jgi:hypothetical protein